MRKFSISRVTAPYLLDPRDPYFPESLIDGGVSIKYLTIKNPWPIIRRTIKRKDGKVAKIKNNKLKQTQYIAIGLLAVAGINGITQFLGGGLRDGIVAAFLAGLLFAFAIDD